MVPFIIETKFLKVRPGFKTRGLAIFPFVFVTDKRDQKLIVHEKEHIWQQIRGFLIFFYIKYAIYHFIYGYHDNPYEVAARKAADNWEKRQ